ncbi:ATPase [Promicromonospora sp. MEB111]|uniref:ATPase n=1 Tax=Promicromonospora sp. MEB111 TaxID=3040301 RepID=UPI00254A5E2F|nr:ATPase [Promicromonospora sp. MEB111]
MSVETAGWPRADVIVRDDGSGQVTINGQTVPVYRNSLGEARSEVMRLVMEFSASVGLAVEVQALGPEGPTGLTVHPDGRVVQDGGAGAAQAAQAALPQSLAQPVAPAQPAHAVPVHAGPPAAGPGAGAAVPQRTSVMGHADQPGAGQHAAVPNGVGQHGVSPHGVGQPGLPPEAPPQDPRDPQGPAPQGIPQQNVPQQDRAPQRPGASFGAQAPGTESPFRPGHDGGRRDNRRSFLVQDRLDEPATQGVRGVLARVGLRVRPGETERAERADEQVVSQHWPGPRTISIVNGKGGAGKTPATVLLSAVFSSHGGSGVVAWDNNQTRGTLGWRTEQGPHEATLLDLIPQTEHFLGPTAQLADLAWFVHHQSRDRFDVLRSKPMALAHEQRISSEDVDAIHAVLAKYYRMIFIDSGNDESDPMWLRMIDHTDQLVVATSTRDDHAEAGALLLEALANRGEHMADLARKAVVVVSQSDPKATPADLRRVAQGYRSLAREVVTVPFDPAMVDGQLVYRALRPQTRRAWLAAGAALARGF